MKPHEPNIMTPVLRKPDIPCLALRLEDAAAAIGISARKLQELKAAGEVPYVPVDSVVLFPIEGLREWLRKNTQGGGLEQRT